MASGLTPKLPLVRDTINDFLLITDYKELVKQNLKNLILTNPGEKIMDEVSASPGYEFNKNNSVIATSGKNKIKFDIVQQGFAWIADNKIEKKMVKVMKKGSRIMITGYNQKGSQTIDHYSLLGFTKAYNAAKKACS